MCGIAGFLDPGRGQPAEALGRTARAMADALAHRGPDGAGEWVDAAAGLALGHRRLAVIDPSPAGAQPMVSADGGYVIAYNGEVYNFAELRRELEAEPGAPVFRGRSDTEVLLEACARWGVEGAVRRAVGMFAFALWDRRERRLCLARDRLGIKPLYWARAGSAVIFASELKGICTHPAFRAELDTGALAAYFRHGYVPAPAAIWRDAFKLRPGHILEVGPDGAVRERAFWELRAIAGSGSRSPARPDPERAADGLEAALREAVRARLVADVPLGAFLSGGIDSSTVVALMAQESSARVRTFTIAFGERGFDEAPHARAVAAHLGTEHTELSVAAEDAQEVIPLLPEIHDEPFADASAIPTALLSALTRRHVTVALSGDGGDEVFAGYDRYRLAGWARLPFLPDPLRRGIGRAVWSVPGTAWDRIARLLPPGRRPPAMGDKLDKLARVLAAGGEDAAYEAAGALWAAPEILVPGAVAPPEDACDPSLARDIPDFLSRMQYLDSVRYLPDDILAKLDRASMAVGLEARVPMLDHRVVEYAWGLDPSLKRRRGTSKWLLRRVLRRFVPPALTDRPKAGFAVPVGAWLRGPLREWAEALMAPERLAREGTLDPAAVTACWREHLAGRRNRSQQLWAVLMFQAWRERWRA